MHVGRLITRNVIACDPQAMPDDLISVMNEKGFRHMPVVEGGSVKGVVSRTDLMRHSSN
jgi:CBS domain-containing protein